MENKKKLRTWLLDHFIELDLQVTQAHWVEDWLWGFHDFRVSIKIEGKIFVGRGIDKDADLAFVKAGAEALERFVCMEYKIPSNGVALHENLESAKANAKNELIERDRLFCHYLTKTPFKEIDPLGLGFDFSHIKDKLKDHGVAIQVFEMNPFGETKSMLCLTRGDGAGFILGSASSENVEAALEKAVLGCLQNTIASLGDSPLKLSLDDFEKLSHTEPEYHRRLYFTENDLIEKNGWMFEGEQTEVLLENKEASEESFTYKKLESKNDLLEYAPVVVVQCDNPFLQKPFYGKFDPEKVNLEQLKNFSGKEQIMENLNRIPHPFG